MGDQTNRMEQKLDYILALLQPKTEKKEEKKNIEQRPTAQQ